MVRWRVIDLVQWLLDEFDISVSKQPLSRELRQMGGAAQGSAHLAGEMAALHIFGAKCPATGATARLVLPWFNTEAMGLHLAEIAARVTPGKHCALGRSGRVARLEPARGSGQHHDRPAAGQVHRVEPGRERLALPARQLAVELDHPLIRRHRRSLLRRLEPPRRPTLARHEPRITKLDARSPAVTLGISSVKNEQPGQKQEWTIPDPQVSTTPRDA